MQRLHNRTPKAPTVQKPLRETVLPTQRTNKSHEIFRFMYSKTKISQLLHLYFLKRHLMLYISFIFYSFLDLLLC